MDTISARKHATEVLIKLSKIPEVFTIEMNDGSKHKATLANSQHIWTGFEHLPNTTLQSPSGPIDIDLYEVRDIY